MYESVYKDMYRFAYYTLRSPYDAEDVVSEAVTDAFSSFGKLRDQDKFKPWIFKILSVKCKRKLKEYTDNAVPYSVHGTAMPPSSEAVDLKEAFSKLTQEERLIISMSVFGGYNSKEISRIIKLNANTVRSKLSRGLEKMKQEIGENYVK